MSEEQNLDPKKPEPTETETSKDEEGAVATATEEAEAAEEQNQDAPADGDQEAEKSQENKKSAQIRVSKRIRKLTETANTANASQEQTARDLAIANERIRIQELALNQKVPSQGVLTQPDPANFDGGVYDPEYIKQVQEYTKTSNQEEVKKQVDEATKQIRQTTTDDNVARDNEKRQRAHYRRVMEHSNHDYEAAEDTVIEILGVNSVKAIINKFDDAHNIIYNLSKNLDSCEDLADAVAANDQVKTIRLLERASEAGFKVKPKNKPTPNPDTPLPGGSPGASGSFEEKRLKMLKKAQDTGDQSVYSDFMDEHRKAVKAEQVKTSPGYW